MLEEGFSGLCSGLSDALADSGTSSSHGVKKSKVTPEA